MRSKAGLLLAALLLPAPLAAQSNDSTPLAAQAADAAPDIEPPVIASSGPLTLAQVLASARFHAPQVLEAMARVRGAEGRLTSTQAAFDTVFSAEAESRAFGYYGGTMGGVSLVQPFSNNGGYAYGGYRISSGAFPVYEDQFVTNQAGEVKAGAIFALMRDRAIDERRFARTLAEADIEIAKADRLMIAIGVQRAALSAYINWVAAGLRLKVFEDLLKLATDRQGGFERQVKEGASPRILLTENEQNILRRESLAVQARQQLDQAAATLSLYLRDGNGRPLIPTADRLPGTLPPLLAPAMARADTGTIASRRPDFRTLEIRIRQQSQRLALDRNNFLPRLDLKVEASQDFGAGSFTRRPGEGKVGLSFTVPLQQSAARGRIAQTNAEIEAVRQRARLLEDQIGAEVTQLAVAVEATAKLRRIAEDEQDRATTMAGAERRRFQAGASDFFLVNVREEAAADAQVRALDAAIRQIAANAELAAVTADLDALGL
jgi:outer membrane protein TolC